MKGVIRLIILIMDSKESLNETERRNGFLLLSKYRNAIMGLAAIWVLLFHAWLPIMPASTPEHFNLFGFLEIYFLDIGYCGVDIFLLVSGIGLTFAIKKGSLLRFYYRRFRRLVLPPLVVSLFLWNIYGWTTKEFFRNISGIDFFIKNTTCYLWFIPAIATLYLLFPLYYKIFEKACKKTLFTAAVIVLWFIISLLLNGHIRENIYGFTNRIPVFIVGILFGYLTQIRKDIVFTKKHYICLTLVLAAGFYFAYLTMNLKHNFILPYVNILPNFLIAVSLPFLIAKLLDLAERYLPKIGKFLAAAIGIFGTFTLELYCVQEWFVKIIGDMMNDGISKHMINLCMFFTINATAWVASMVFKYFWELVELPFKRKKTA